MRWKFINKIEGLKSSKNKFKKVILAIGIGCLFFAMIMQFKLGYKGAWIFIIPIISLAGSIKQLTKNRMTFNIPIQVAICEDDIEIVFINTIKNKRGLFSEKYQFKTCDVENCIYEKERHLLRIIAYCKYQKFNKILCEIGEERMRNLKFELTKENEEEILGELSKKNVVNRYE